MAYATEDLNIHDVYDYDSDDQAMTDYVWAGATEERPYAQAAQPNTSLGNSAVRRDLKANHWK